MNVTMKTETEIETVQRDDMTMSMLCAMSSSLSVLTQYSAPAVMSMSGTLNVGEKASSSCKFKELMTMFSPLLRLLLLLQNAKPSASLSSFFSETSHSHVQ